MKRRADVPNCSKEMQAIYDKLLKTNVDFEDILPHIDDFLKKYPNYAEAHVLKARALMAIGRNNEALRSLKMAKRADKWRLIGRFDEAEIYLEKDKKVESIEAYIDAIKAYTIELKNGIDAYLLSCNPKSRNRIQKLTQQALADFFKNDTKNKPFEKLQKGIEKIKDKMSFE